ncbi:MAG: S8 family serine peptidase [Erysipelothrix sp.]|nr:S8 family serine peptidase [Erysipelothrix sp.]
MKHWTRSLTMLITFLGLSFSRISATSPSDFVQSFLNQPNPDLIVLMRRPTQLQHSNPLFNLSSHTQIQGFESSIINEEFKDEPYILHLQSPTHESTLRALKTLQSDARVLAIEVDELRTPTKTYNDPGRINQWYLNDLSLSSAHDNLELFNLPYGGLSDIVVAVIDTGLSANHPEFNDRLWTNTLEIPNDGIDNDLNGIIDDINGINSDTMTNDFDDKEGHGTHVSGIIGAATNNQLGMVSIAPNVSIMPIKASRFFPSENQELLPSSAIYNGLMYAYQHGAHIVNMSFGSKVYLESEESLMRSLSQHMILVAAAGNNGKAITTEAYYPAAYEGVVGVMAYKQLPNLNGSILANFSNYDNESDPIRNYDIMAPGQGIYSSHLNQGYTNLNGTSMAAPMVSGVFALLLSKLGGFNVYSPQSMVDHLINSNDKALGIVVNSTEYHYPQLNALNSILVNPQIERIQVIDLNDGSYQINVWGDYFLQGLSVLINTTPITSIIHDSMKHVSVIVSGLDLIDDTLTLLHPDNTQMSVTLPTTPDILVSDLIISPTELVFTSTAPQTLQVSVTPNNATDQKVIFTSLDPNIISVNEQGVVTPIRNGNTLIQIRSNDGNITKTIEVRVELPLVNLNFRINDDRFPDKGLINATMSDSNILITSGSQVATNSTITFSVELPTRYVIIAWIINGQRVETRDRNRSVTLNQSNNTIVVEVIRRGDLNNDGQMTTTDLVQLQRLLAGILPTSLERELAGDVNESGTLTSTDLVQLMRLLAGIPIGDE